MKIVSLVPCVTETLSAWGRTPIACTRFCERPDLTHVGGTKDPDIAGIVDISPDLVVVDAEENRREDYAALIEHGISVHVTHVRSLIDLGPAMSSLAERVEATWSPTVLTDVSFARLRAFIPIWRRPWMALGTPSYGSSLLAHLGVTNVFDSQGSYPTVSLEEAFERHPDVVLAPSEPYPFTRRQLPELQTVAPTTFVDGKDLFWWGVRTEGAFIRLREVFSSL